MKRHSQWMAMALMAGTLGVTSATGQVFTESWDNEPIAEGRIIERSGEPIVLQERTSTTRRNAWVARRDQLRTSRSGYVLVEGARSDRALMETSPVVSREVIELEPIAEKRGRCATKPMRHVYIRQRLAPVAEGPLHSGPATVRERTYFKKTYIPPRFHSSKAKAELEPVAERANYRVKRTVKRAGEPLRTSTRNVTIATEELEPVAERTVTVEPIYERIDDRPRQRAGWSIFDFGNPYR